MTLHNKACTLLKLGRLGESDELFRRIYKVKVRVWGEDDASTLLTRFWMAFVLEKHGNWRGGLKIHEEVYEARKRVLGPEHPHTTISMSRISECRFVLKK